MDDKTKIKFGKLVINCQAFYRVATMLWEDYSCDETIENVVTIVVNSVFACELALKAILMKSEKDYCRVHKLYELYSELEPEEKECILLALKQFYPSQTEEWLVDSIKIASDIYQKARYFQDYTIAIDLTFCRNLMEALFSVKQKICGIYGVKDMSGEVEVDEQRLDSEINKTLTDMVAEAEKSKKIVVEYDIKNIR
ncbi:MAG: HEPN domain-containing protein [Clostridiales bacterium]|nr:HEPN domain-containing protein [Clostridiales bacterium]